MSRPLFEIATEIGNLWPKVKETGTPSPFGNIGQNPANPYWKAMLALDSIQDNYDLDDAASIVRYFIGNARGWRGEDARRIKTELNGMVAAK